MLWDKNVYVLCLGIKKQIFSFLGYHGGRGGHRGGGRGGGSRGGGQNHPGHLTGKDIGLWYASRGKKRQEMLERLEVFFFASFIPPWCDLDRFIEIYSSDQ